MQYENDYELIYLIHSNDETAVRLLMEKYESLARVIIHRFQKSENRNNVHDDLMQLARLKLMQAVNSYRPECEVPFFCYYEEIFRNAMIDNYRERFTYKSACELFALSLDMQVSDVYEQYTYVDILTAEQLGISPSVCDRIHNLKTNLFPIERRIVDLRIQGYTYAQISKLLDISTKKVDNTMRKVRKSKKKKRMN